MNHLPSHNSDLSPIPTGTDTVLCRVPDAETLEAIVAVPDPLEQIGFTGLVIPAGVDVDLQPLTQRGFSINHEHEIDGYFDYSTFTADRSPRANELWSQLEQSPQVSMGMDLSTLNKGHEAATLVQLSVPVAPVVPVDGGILYSTGLREQRELLRSMIFWRKRNGIAGHRPNLIHAGEDGLLIFSVDFWLIAINQNSEEASIELGSHGSMWLMLGTHRDVHLHGSMLILPPFSGAVLANELAR